MPSEGIDLMDYLVNKYGEEARSRFGDPNSSLSTMGRAVGIEFDNNRKIYNTVAAHALVEAIKKEDNNKANSLMKMLYELYFVQGRDISNASILSQAAQVSDDEFQKIVTEWSSTVREKDRLYKTEWNVSGVPFYVIHSSEKEDDSVAFSGAYPIGAIAKQLKEAAKK